MKNFWKSRLRKWISIVAAMVLLLNTVLPTVPVFAYDNQDDCEFNHLTWNGESCEDPQCKWTVPANSRLINGIGESTQDVDNALYETQENAESHQCSYICGVYYGYNNGSCVLEYVAQVDNVWYSTFEEAVTASQWGTKVITLLTGAGTYTMSIGQTLKVAKNWKSITVNGPDYYVVKFSTSEWVTTYTLVEADIEHINLSNVVSYKTADDLGALNSEWTYKLLKDITRTQRMAYGTWADDVTIDLNWYTLTSTASDYAILLGRGWTAATHRTFSIIDTSVGKWWKIIFSTTPTSSTALISVSWKYNDVTIWEWVILEGGAVAIFWENQTLNVNGVINWWDDFAIATNGSSTVNAIINVNDWSEISSNQTAIYLPWKTNLTATINGQVTWKTAVEIRAGTLTIGENAELTATWEFSEAENWDGTTVNGAALAVSQHTTNLPIDVTINWWKFVWSKALYEKDLEDTTVDNINMAVIDGEFDGVVYSQNVERFIAWWTYSSDPSAYVVSGKQAIQEGWVWTISDYTPNPDGSINCSADSVVAELENSANPWVKTCYISISDAVDAAPKNSTTTSTITVKEGTYTDYNNVQVEWSRNIVMKWEEGKTVVFTHTTTATDQYAMVVVWQWSIRFENITFELIQWWSSHTHWIGVAQW